MCLVFNILILIAFGVEAWKDYDVILDKNQPIANRKKYIVSLAIAAVVSGIALFTIYKLFGINSENLIKYIQLGHI